MQEIWKPVNGYEHIYDVSNLGRMRRSLSTVPHDGTFPGRILNGTVLKGYLKINMSKDCKKRLLFLHRFVALAFVPNLYNKPQVNHIDGNKLNNHFSNLEWVTSKENNQHAMKIGLRSGFGMSHYKSKLKNTDILKIRKLWEKGAIEQKEIAKMFDVTAPLISAIVLRKIWKHL